MGRALGDYVRSFLQAVSLWFWLLWLWVGYGMLGYLMWPRGLALPLPVLLEKQPFNLIFLAVTCLLPVAMAGCDLQLMALGYGLSLLVVLGLMVFAGFGIQWLLVAIALGLGLVAVPMGLMGLEATLNRSQARWSLLKHRPLVRSLAVFLELVLCGIGLGTGLLILQLRS
ncbi:MAG: hypothetical protein HC919_08800 [Oscillatoriales cyanobacterium SM2_2_1]|nr:hypothetical protein [Oscillatoriales cyanobacterium SM2_2_1]